MTDDKTEFPVRTEILVLGPDDPNKPKIGEPINEPEFSEMFKQMPVRTELTVLSADDPKARTIGFSVKEYNGCEIKTVPPGLTHEQLMNTGNWPEGFEPQIIKELDGIKPGDFILAPTMFGSTIAVVEAMEDGDLCGYSRDRSHLYMLEFGKDDRECWVCGGSGNIKAIQKLELSW